MNYLNIYNNLIEKAKSREDITGYYEIHHIIPKCLGGDNSDENKVKLTYREHFVAHWLLHLIHHDNNKLEYSFKLMAFGWKWKNNNKIVPSSRIFEKKKIEFLSTPLSDEVKNKIKIKRHKRKLKKEKLNLNNPQKIKEPKISIGVKKLLAKREKDRLAKIENEILEAEKLAKEEMNIVNIKRKLTLGERKLFEKIKTDYLAKITNGKL